MNAYDFETELANKISSYYDVEVMYSKREPYTLYRARDLGVLSGIMDIETFIRGYDNTEKEEFYGNKGCASFLTYTGLCSLASSTKKQPVITDLEIENYKLQLSMNKGLQQKNMVENAEVSYLLQKVEDLTRENSFFEKMAEELIEKIEQLKKLNSRNEWQDLVI